MVMREDMLSYVDQLLPVLIYNMQDGSSVQKQETAVRSLGQLVTATGLVIRPYLRFPDLLPKALDLLLSGNATPWTLRREVLRTLGLLGALEPHKYGLIREHLKRVQERRAETRKKAELSAGESKKGQQQQQQPHQSQQQQGDGGGGGTNGGGGGGGFPGVTGGLVGGPFPPANADDSGRTGGFGATGVGDPLGGGNGASLLGAKGDMRDPKSPSSGGPAGGADAESELPQFSSEVVYTEEDSAEMPAYKVYHHYHHHAIIAVIISVSLLSPLLSSLHHHPLSHFHSLCITLNHHPLSHSHSLCMILTSYTPYVTPCSTPTTHNPSTGYVRTVSGGSQVREHLGRAHAPHPVQRGLLPASVHHKPHEDPVRPQSQHASLGCHARYHVPRTTTTTTSLSPSFLPSFLSDVPSLLPSPPL